MSYLAIGAVTKSMAELLAKKMNKPPLLGATTPKVTTLPPDDDRVDDNDGVNLFLYRVTEDPFTKNTDWRGDKSNPAARRPPLSLNLYYLLTSYAKKANGAAQDDITAHQLLGNAMAILNEFPVLNDIHDGDFDADLDTQFAQELRDSFEKIKITLMPNSMEEFSKIWTGLNKAYRLSVTYEVSLVQIAPTVAVSGAQPAIQKVSLDVSVSGGPVLASLTPATGTAGQQVILKGKGFVERGKDTAVMIDDLRLEETDLVSLSETQIVLNIPAALQRGPRLRVSVVVGNKESEPQTYEVSPWVSTIQPLRGITGVPLTFTLEVPATGTVEAEIDGTTVPTTADAEKKVIRAVVPAITTNGPKSVALVINTKHTNVRLYEVLPLITNVNVTTVASPAKTTIALTGLRLNGNDVKIRYGKLILNTGANANPASLSFDVDKRVLPTNLPASVIVDGKESNVWPPKLENIEPSSAFTGDEITITGSGLSGAAVTVDFGGTPEVVGPQANAGRFKVKVPAALAAGTVAVKVTVNGKDTNSRSFVVLG